VQIRALGPGDDRGELFDLRIRAFGPATRDERDRWLAVAERAIADQRYLAAFEGTRMVAAAKFHDLVQSWLGASLPMAGVAAVAVAPEDRGKGIGGALIGALLSHIDARGYPLSMLYPATPSLYRSAGWELAGHTYEAVLPARSLRTIAPWTGPQSPALRRAVPGDAPAVRGVHAAVHASARDCGPLIWDEATTRQRIADDRVFSYLADDGYLAYRWHGGHDEILVERAIAGSQATTRALWAVLASSSSIAQTLRVRVSPAEPFWLLMSERDLELTDDDQWMLRVVDAPAAVAGRGFPAGLELAVPLRLQDAARQGNRGDWTLKVSSGKGSLETSQTAAAAPLALGARGFAALYAGTTVPVLRRAGLASGGDPTADALLDAAFAAQPFCLDSF
jgi:predicted acetyltransferase